MVKLRNAVLSVFVRREDVKVDVLNCLCDDRNAVVVVEGFEAACFAGRKARGQWSADRVLRRANMMAGGGLVRDGKWRWSM